MARLRLAPTYQHEGQKDLLASNSNKRVKLHRCCVTSGDLPSERVLHRSVRPRRELSVYQRHVKLVCKKLDMCEYSHGLEHAVLLNNLRKTLETTYKTPAGGPTARAHAGALFECYESQAFRGHRHVDRPSSPLRKVEIAVVEQQPKEEEETRHIDDELTFPFCDASSTILSLDSPWDPVHCEATSPPPRELPPPRPRSPINKMLYSAESSSAVRRLLNIDIDCTPPCLVHFNIDTSDSCQSMGNNCDAVLETSWIAT
jgi:hypothetical protein